MKINLFCAVVTGRMVALASRLSGHGGSSLPGLVAGKIYHRCLHDLAGQVRKGIIMVTGTNGKTTTTNMIAGILEKARFKVVANYEGANMASGVTTSFIMKAGLSGKIDCDYAIIEVDEASVPGVMKELNPEIVVITNFFRDQLDRYWEIEKVVGVIRDALNKYGYANLVLNADDPLVAQFGRITRLPATFYGIGRHGQSTATSTRTREAKRCPFCGAALVYDFFHYGQLGNYRCAECSFKRPEPGLVAMDATVTDKINCRMVYNGDEAQLAIQTTGIYNLYNALAAFATGLQLGIDAAVILSGLNRYRPVTGRMENFDYRGKPVFLILVKNPTGFNEGLSALFFNQRKKDVFIAINDNDADGKDVSWLWDVDFEILGNGQQFFNSFLCTGKRGEEMAVRLKYAGVPQDKIAVDPDMPSAVKKILDGPGKQSYFFSTYTALRQVHGILEALIAGGNKK